VVGNCGVAHTSLPGSQQRSSGRAMLLLWLLQLKPNLLL
jgi:hypothetical protein